jgi:hypothetical protein
MKSEEVEIERREEHLGRHEPVGDLRNVRAHSRADRPPCEHRAASIV